jgi:hypothetical protein
MKRTDFFKALGALIISPLAVKGLLKDNGCPPQHDVLPIAKKDLKKNTGGIWDYLVDKGQNGNINTLKWEDPYELDAELYRKFSMFDWLTVKG